MVDSTHTCNRSIQRLLAIAFLTPLLSLVFSDHAFAQQWARDMFPSALYDFGTVASGSNAQYLFEITNNTKHVVHISGVKTSCGCTSPSSIKDTIRPGEQGGILAKLNTGAYFGHRSATITVVFDRPFYAEVQLLVSANILADVSFNPTEVAFGELPLGAEPGRTFQVSFRNRPQLKIEDVRCERTDFRVRLGQKRVEASDTVYTIQVFLKPDCPAGPINERLNLVTNDNEIKSVQIGVSGNVRPPVEVKPASVHLNATAGKTLETRLVLVGQAPFAIESVTCEDNRISFQIPEGEKKVHFVKVAFAGDSEETGGFKVPITFKTNAPNCSGATCLITGTVTVAPE